MAYLLVLLAAGAACGRGRLVPHPRNSSPVLATALFAGALLPGRLAPSFMAEHTAAGPHRCYVAALPFFRNALSGDILWTTALFGAYDLAQAWTRQPLARRAG
jgi:hypothetical protein